MDKRDSVTIKKATNDDLRLLFKICRESYSENFAHHWNEGGLAWYLDKVFGMARIESELINPGINYFIAFFEENP